MCLYHVTDSCGRVVGNSSLCLSFAYRVLVPAVGTHLVWEE